MCAVSVLRIIFQRAIRSHDALFGQVETHFFLLKRQIWRLRMNQNLIFLIFYVLSLKHFKHVLKLRGMKFPKTDTGHLKRTTMSDGHKCLP